MPALGSMGHSGFGRLGAVGNASYNPLAALGPDLLAWWDADPRYWGANGGFTTATGISAWRDVVAGYNAAQATGSPQPALSAATAFGSFNVPVFDGSDDNLTCTDAPLLAALPSGANASELWALVQQDAAPADTTARVVAGYGGTTNQTGRRLSRTVVAGVNRANGLTGNNSTGPNINGTIVDLSTRHALRWQVQAPAGTSLLTVDGVAEGSLAADPSLVAAPNKFRIGATTTTAANNVWQGPIAAVLVTNALSAGKAAGLQAWLMSRRKV